MSRRSFYSVVALIIILFSIWYYSESGKENDKFSERVKVSLRDVGNSLLLANQDSTSLVLPVVELENTKYQLTFQNKLTIEPRNLVSTIESSFEKASLPINYLVEVIQCSHKEVAYSYEMNNTEEKSIIPCFGRVLEKDCYVIKVIFVKKATLVSSKKPYLYILIIIVLIFLQVIFYKRKQITEENPSAEKTVIDEHTAIGSFQFYPDQNKLVKEAVEISLSKKECELLAIFIANPNQIIKRDELSKRVWEDHGVIVGRSLDTYISKLRKKLKEDTSIKLTNVHGIGYKLEVNNIN